MKVTLAAGLLLLAGCSTATPDAPTPTTPAVASPTAADAPSSTGRPVRVPFVVGSALREVRPALAQQGLRVAVRHRARCVPGVVLAQDPAPSSTLRSGDTIEVVVATYPPAATCAVPAGRQAVGDLREWAAGEAGPPRFADRVRLLVGNHPVRTLSRAEAADPSSWVLDVAYAERVEVSVLDALRGPPVRGSWVPPYSCMNRSPRLPEDLVDRLPVSWTLTTRRTPRTIACMQLTSVQVWADPERGITDVDVLMGSP